MGEIINRNKQLRESLDHQQQELNKYKTQALSDFVPIEIYNDEKRQYIISILQRQHTPFVEEEHALYVQECYAASVKKLAAEYKVNSNPTMREKLKFTLDRLVYTAVSFENMLELLGQMGYRVKRGKYIAIKPPYAQRFMRLRSLGKGYSEFELKQRIERRNEIPDEFKQSEEYYANDLQKPFYGTINRVITLVRTFAFTPAKKDANKMYSFTNDKTIDRLCCCLGTLSEFNINSREELYKAAEDLQECIDNSNGDKSDDLKKQLTQISSVIRTYEEIIEGNYIDNLIRAEKERREPLKSSNEHKTAQTKDKDKAKTTQTINRKKHR